PSDLAVREYWTDAGRLMAHQAHIGRRWSHCAPPAQVGRADAPRWIAWPRPDPTQDSPGQDLAIAAPSPVACPLVGWSWVALLRAECLAHLRSRRRGLPGFWPSHQQVPAGRSAVPLRS